jgi:drug/metabolite transporter (DMT)-like permease
VLLTVALSLSAALTYGVSDFLGAVGARRTGVLNGTAITYSLALVSLVVFWAFVGGTPSTAAVAWGAVAGVAAIVGFLFFYAALAAGPISLAAPLIAVVGSLVPVGVALLRGERLSLIAWVAVVLALAGAALISVTRRGAPVGIPPRTVVFSVLAGGMLGLSIVGLDFAPTESGLLSAVVEIAVGVALLGVLLIANRWTPVRQVLAVLDADHGHGGQERGPGEVGDVGVVTVGRARLSSASGGILLGIANGLIVLALHSGSLAIVSVLVGLYPIGTIVLARIVHGERLEPVQLLGVVVAIAASVVLALPQ